MTRRLLPVAAVLGMGSLVAGALYWAFINTPDANVLMLVVSALLALAFIVVVGVTINTAVLSATSAPVRRAVPAALRGLPWFLAAAAIVVTGWWIVGTAEEWVAAHAGEINAWFIATFNWADISVLSGAIHWLGLWLRWAALPLVALLMLTARLARAHRDATRGRPPVWRLLAIATFVFLFLFMLPWQLTAWRPAVPSTTLEPIVAAARLGAVALCALAGAAIVVLAAAGQKLESSKF